MPPLPEVGGAGMEMFSPRNPHRILRMDADGPKAVQVFLLVWNWCIYCRFDHSHSYLAHSSYLHCSLDNHIPCFFPNPFHSAPISPTSYLGRTSLVHVSNLFEDDDSVSDEH